MIPPYLRMWSKTDRSRGANSATHHTVLGHLLDVAAVGEELLVTRSGEHLERIGAWIHPSNPLNGVRWILATIALHDLGKAAPAFAQKRQDLNPFDPVQAFPFAQPHATVSEKLLRFHLTPHLGRTAATRLGHIAGAHHGTRQPRASLRSITKREAGLFEPYIGAQLALIRDVLGALGAESIPPSEQVQDHVIDIPYHEFVRVTGLASIADWIGSSLPFQPPVADPHAYYKDARERAHERLARIGWDVAPQVRVHFTTWEATVSHVLSEGRFTPNAIQSLTKAWVSEAREPSLVIIESPMGGGKTEAAFTVWAYNEMRGVTHGAYVGMPTQATGAAMFSRVKEFLEANLENGAAQLHLLYGGSTQHRTYAELLDRAGDEREADVIASEWFTRSGQGLLARYGTGTIDQALLGALAARHHWVRLWGLQNKTVILDEVHAYDAYTGLMLTHLIRWLHALDCSVIILSATLPTETRAQLIEAYGSPAQTIDSPAYPRVSYVAHSGSVRAAHVALPTTSPPAVHVTSAPHAIEPLADQALALTRDGGNLAIIVNSVKRAQQLHRAIEERGVTPLLFHARFSQGQRLDKEKTLLKTYGKPGSHTTSRPEASVVISTQVIEQSLDLDFDAMISDLAPIDLLLQRAGRLHRHVRAHRPPGHEKPVLYVAGANNFTEAPEPNALNSVYSQMVVLRTWLELSRHGTLLTFPTDIDDLVQAVYGATMTPITPHLQEVIRDAARDHATLTTALESAASTQLAPHPDEALMASGRDLTLVNTLGDADPYADHDNAESVATRAGRPGIVVLPLAPNGTAFADPGLAVEARATLATRNPADRATIDRILLATYRLSGWKADKVRAATNPNPAWRSCGPLAHVHILHLDQAGVVTNLDSANLTFDQNLGVLT